MYLSHDAHLHSVSHHGRMAVMTKIKKSVEYYIKTLKWGRTINAQPN